MSEHNRFVSGFVAILGRPNVGKSTLLNALVGSKIAIVTDKPQTTRNRIQGVVHQPNAQIIFLDTPGIHRADTRMNQRMMAEVREALKGCDLLLLMVDASRESGTGDQQALAMVQKLAIPAFLLPNKIDLLANKESLLPLIDRYRQQHPFAEIIPISAIAADGLQTLVERILAALPEGPQYFPPEYLTDQPARFLAAEIIRERVIALTRHELPYATMVLVDRFEEKPNLLRIHAAVFAERPGQKAILIGVRGEMMKKIGTQAREELEKRFGQKVYLELFVKVRPAWRENPRFLRAIDWRSMVGETSVTSDE
ncbi:MAG: GTPase Era [Acidobacteria bacterium]|jgi:GTP-binding protein Era|nr:GTPase Era [Acidobacteriota bacterium]